MKEGRPTQKPLLQEWEPRWGSWGGLDQVSTWEFKAVLHDCSYLGLVPRREVGLTNQCIEVL